MYHTLSIRPRISETDLMGHINNVTPAIWMEEGRTYFFRELLPGSPVPPLMIRHVEIDYRGQLFMENLVDLCTAVQRIGNTSLTLYQEILQNGELCVVGLSTLVFIDPATDRPTPVPDKVKAAFAPYLLKSDDK